MKTLTLLQLQQTIAEANIPTHTHTHTHTPPPPPPRPADIFLIFKEGKIVTHPFNRLPKKAGEVLCKLFPKSWVWLCVHCLEVVHCWNWAEKSIIWVSDTSNYQPSQAFWKIAKVFANFWQSMKMKSRKEYRFEFRFEHFTSGKKKTQFLLLLIFSSFLTFNGNSVLSYVLLYVQQISTINWSKLCWFKAYPTCVSSISLKRCTFIL